MAKAVVLYLPCHDLAVRSSNSCSMLRADGTTNMVQEADVMIVFCKVLRLGRRTSQSVDAAVVVLVDRHITSSEWVHCMVMGVITGSIHLLGREWHSDRFLAEEGCRLVLCPSCRHGLSLLVRLVSGSHGIRCRVGMWRMDLILLVGCSKHWHNEGWVHYPFAPPT